MPTRTSGTTAAVVVVLVVVGVVIVVLVGVSAAIHEDDPANDDLCLVVRRLSSDVTDALAVAASDDATARDLRDHLDEIEVDLAALSSAADGRFETQIAQMVASARDLRLSLTDLDDDTPSDVARPLVDEAIEDARPPYRQLLDDIEPVCADRS
jgi:hypothetical protein